MRRSVLVSLLVGVLPTVSCSRTEAPTGPAGSVMITTTSLPAATRNAAYAQTLAATGGSGSYTWSVSSGSLPTGLSLDASTGEVSGTPTTVERESFAVRAESSDAEPATREFTIDVVDDAPSGITVTESGGGTVVSEGATVDSLTVALEAQPITSVVLSVSSANTAEVTVAPSTLTFTNATWDVPQTVVVTGVDDAIADGDQSTDISISVDDANSDDRFDPVGDETVSVTTTDDDLAAAGFTWAWMSGDSLGNQLASYGAIDVPSASNVPGARYRHAGWVQSTGDVWVFGGNGYDETGTRDILNDLWHFDGTNWTWVAGTSTFDQFGSYGTQGSGAPANTPGSRWETTTAVGPDDHLWLFGGLGWGASSTGRLNDLWRFDGTNWIWVDGSGGSNREGDYYTKGSPHPLSVPGGRRGAVMWVDASGDVWLFGGHGSGDTGFVPPIGQEYGHLNDLWRFDGSEWTWVSGSSKLNRPGVYGTRGVPDPANVPGGRQDAVGWVDGSGNLWLYGGVGYAADPTRSSPLSDLWRFDGTNWTWMAGPSTSATATVYGELGVPSAGNTPGRRSGAPSWVDGSGDLWLVGGNGLSDVWRFDGSTWTWMAGDSTAYSDRRYGVRGVPSPDNEPGWRTWAAGGIDGGGNVWMFGGSGADGGIGVVLNDLWRLTSN